MRVVVVGHVDHGKSTLIGRMFHDAGAMAQGKHAQLTAAAERRGVAFEFANLTDGLQQERAQNVTIDTTQILLRAGGREILFIDAPGHREFIKNMVTGAAQADAAILVVDVTEGVSDQTRRHALLLTLLGITQIIVVINKMDRLASGDLRSGDLRSPEVRFGDLRSSIKHLLGSVGLEPAAIVPAAASLGWNVVNRAEELAWFPGPTVLEALERFGEPRNQEPRNPGTPEPRNPFIYSVQDVYRRDARRVLVGRTESGSCSAGLPILVLPSGFPATVEPYERQSSSFVIREPLFLSRGDVLASPNSGLVVTTSIRARIFWLGRLPMTHDRRYQVRLGTQRAESELASITRVVDASALAERSDLSCVPPHDVAEVELRLFRPLVVDPSMRVRALARLVIVDHAAGGDIVGGGLVMEAVPVAAPARSSASASVAVTMAERRARSGHRGMVVWLTGLSGSGKSTLAEGLERVLFDRGLQVAVLDGDSVRFGLNADLGFSPEDRRENIRRVAEVARLFAERGVIVITAFISPSAEDRQRARAIVAGRDVSTTVDFLEVFVDADLAVCEGRDPKGLYRKARAGEISDFTGVSAPYDIPVDADLVIRTAECTLADGVAALVAEVVRRAGL
jgi:bifunctional enzyme CysN/CysC